MSRLEVLQNFVLERIKSDSVLSQSQISRMGFYEKEEFAAKNGISISVSIPMPTRVSKYTAGSPFAEVIFQICVCKKNISSASPSPVAVCEKISSLLHNWSTPLESGYGKIFLAESSPWKIEKSDAGETRLNINFQAQSLLQ